MSQEQHYCDDLFTAFTFNDMRTASPPKKKGIYVIRVKSRGKDIDRVVSQTNKIVRKLDWPLVEKHALKRIARLERVSECSVIYIGSAGHRQESKFTLKGRYADFTGRHTVMYPILALFYFDWELEFGWKEIENSGDAEKELKEQYKNRHAGRLPALVEK